MSEFDLDWNGEEFFVEVKDINTKAMREAALTVEREAKLSFGKGASMPFLRFNASVLGATVKRGKRKRHRVSAPGFPPNVDTGVLKSSVSTEVGRTQRSAVEVEGFVGSDIVKIARKLSKNKVKNITQKKLEYGFFLEVGTRNMQPRPWLRPALKKSGPEILKIFREANS